MSYIQIRIDDELKEESVKSKTIVPNIVSFLFANQ